MTLTKKHIEALLTAPFDEYEGEESLDVEQEADGVLEVRFGRFSVGGYSRYVTPKGDVMRYAENTDELVAAPWEPLVGSYPAWHFKDGERVHVTRTYRY